MPRVLTQTTTIPKVFREESGIPGLDNLVEGGFVKNSINLIAGQTGTGKTIFGMQFLLQGLKNGESCVYLTLEQKVEDILADMSKFGWDVEFKKYIAAGKFILSSHNPSDIKDLEAVSYQYIKKVNASRFVLDSLSIATMGWKLSSMDIGKIRGEIFSYMAMLKNSGTTTLLITEIPEAEEKKLSRFGFEEFLADGIIKLHFLEYATSGTPRSISIRKMRRTTHETGVYPLEISKNGMRVLPAKKGIIV